MARDLDISERAELERLRQFANKVAWRCHLIIGGFSGGTTEAELDWQLETVYGHLDAVMNHPAPS